jgi:transcriptional regulator with XRE-family HTH domain
MSDFGRELTRLMAERGVSVRQLARDCFVNPGHISNIRNGKDRPSEKLARALDDYLGADGLLSAFAAVPPAGSRARDAGQEDAGPQPWQLVGTLTRSSLDLTAVGFMEDAVTSLAARYPFTPPAELAPEVRSVLSSVNVALRQPQPLKVRMRCVRLAGILSGIAGQIADDTARPDLSAGWFGAAAVAADEIGDADLKAWSLALRSIGCYFRAEYALAGTLLDQAADAGSSSAPRRRAWLAVLSARAKAAVAADRDMVREGGVEVIKAIEDARAYLDAAGEPSGTDFLDGPRLAGMAGTAMLRLRDTRQARPLIGEALLGRSEADVKGRALLTLDLAECMAADNEPEGAARTAARAVSMTPDGIVRPVIARARAVQAALRPWSGTTAVRDLGDQLAELRPARAES